MVIKKKLSKPDLLQGTIQRSHSGPKRLKNPKCSQRLKWSGIQKFSFNVSLESKYVIFLGHPVWLWGAKPQNHLFCSLYGFADGLTRQLPCLPPTHLSPGGSSIFTLSLVMWHFLVPCYVLLSCPLICVTFLSLVMSNFLVPCYVLLSSPLLFVTFLSLVMCFFLVSC